MEISSYPSIHLFYLIRARHIIVRVRGGSIECLNKWSGVQHGRGRFNIELDGTNRQFRIYNLMDTLLACILNRVFYILRSITK